MTHNRFGIIGSGWISFYKKEYGNILEIHNECFNNNSECNSGDSCDVGLN